MIERRYQIAASGHKGAVTGLVDIRAGGEAAEAIAAIFRQADLDVQQVLDAKPAAYDPQRPPRCAACGCPGTVHPVVEQAALGSPERGTCRLCNKCPGYTHTKPAADAVQA